MKGETVFNKLKNAFKEVLVLAYYDLKCKTVIEANALNWALRGVFF